MLGLLAGLGVTLAGALAFVNAKVAPTGTGYYAKILCSAAFIAELPEERIKAEELRPYWYVQGSVDREAKTVTTRLFGMAKRVAVYREGLGCTLAIGASEEQLRAQTPEFPPRPAGEDELWPVGERLPEEPVPGVDYDKLEAAIDYGFADPSPESPALTRAVVVVHGDRLVAERYAEGIDADTRLLGWSMTKSVNATLVGLLVREGKLDLHAPAPVPAWHEREGDPRADITLDQLMRMSSGLKFEEVYGPLSDATYMLFEAHDAAKVAIDMPLAHEPDTVWSYSSGTSNILGWIVRDTLESESSWADYATFAQRELFNPVHMRSALLEPDPSGTFVASSFSHASARDWARFGLLYLRDGVWQGQRILPEGWAKYVSTPTPPSERQEYGAQFWLNAGKAKYPSVPEDMYKASGFQGQRVYIIPSRDAVIVRLGMSHDSDAVDFDGFVARVLDALPPGEG